MAKYVGYKRPKNTKKAMKNLLRYLGYHKWLLLLVAVLVAISSGVSIAGTYLIRPVINDYAIPGDIPGLIRMMLAMGIPAGSDGNPERSVCPYSEAAAGLF